MQVSQLDVHCECGEIGHIENIFLAEGHYLMVHFECLECKKKLFVMFSLSHLITQCPEPTTDELFLKEAKIIPY